MAASLASNFVIRDAEFEAGFIETLGKNIDVFGAGNGGCINIITQDQEGHYAKQRFFDQPSLIAERDITSLSAVADTALTQDEQISVKLNRKIKPHGASRDSMKKVMRDPGEFAFLLGEKIGEQVTEDYMEAAINAVEGALSGQSALVYDGSAATLTHANMINALALFGDAGNRIKAWVMHSAPFYHLLAANITVASGNVAGMTLVQGQVASLNRPIIVTDSTNLQYGSTPDYAVLGLVENAVTITETERPYVTMAEVTGLENLVVRIQGEFAFNVAVKGFKWDTTNGGTSPAAAAVGTATNWDKVVSSDKDLAGVYLQVSA
jgi:hypothetical protein